MFFVKYFFMLWVKKFDELPAYALFISISNFMESLLEKLMVLTYWIIVSYNTSCEIFGEGYGKSNCFFGLNTGLAAITISNNAAILS